MVIEIVDLSSKHGDFPYSMWVKQCDKPAMTGTGKHTLPPINMVMTGGCFMALF
jgi:hypothetical protein